MTVPGICDCSDVGLDDGLCFADLTLVKPCRDGQMDMRRQPELGLAIWMRDMNMNARFFP